MTNSTKCTFPSVSLYNFPRHLRGKLNSRRRRRAQKDPAYNDVVEVGYHEVGILCCQSKGAELNMTPPCVKSEIEKESRWRTASAP